MGLLGSAITLYLVANFGRITIFQMGLLLIAALQFTNTYLYFQEGTFSVLFGIAVCTILFRAIFGSTVGPIPWIYMPEAVKPKQAPLVILVLWLATTLIATLYPILKAYFGNAGYIFGIFGFFSILGAIILAIAAVETKGKSEREIKKEYEELAIKLKSKFFGK